MEEVIVSFKYTKDNLIHWNDYETEFKNTNPGLYAEVKRQQSKLSFAYKHKQKTIDVIIEGNKISKDLEEWIISSVNHFASK